MPDWQKCRCALTSRSLNSAADDHHDLEAKRKAEAEAFRMLVNGETYGQMEHVRAMKEAGGVSLSQSTGNDTSKSQAWPLEDSPRTDWYVFACTVVFLGLKVVVFAIPVLLTTFMAMLLVRLYISGFMPGTDRIRRNWCFYFTFALLVSFSLPAVLVITLSLAWDYLFYYLASWSYCLVTCRWREACRGFEKIEPYRHGPGILAHAPDLFIALMGQCARQSIGETWYMASVMVLIMPWLKYFVCCNPYIYDLDHRLVQQISTSMSDLGTPEDVANASKRIISRAKQLPSMAKRIDLWSFVPHYPYPRPGMRFSLGLQAGGGSYPGKFTLIVHTTHADSKVEGVGEHFVLSNSCERPIYRVMLWYSNPFHFLTGWVEASVSTGQPSQPDKFRGGEHPMWLVSGKSRMVAGREGFTGTGMIDAFFDYWLPVFVHEMRHSVMKDRLGNDSSAALRVADEMYQEVDWNDDEVRSPPRQEVGREEYNGTDTLSQYQAQGERQWEVTRQARELAEALPELEVVHQVNRLQKSRLGPGDVV
eukprot:TRINITY_DN101567_c0_g1_i1.p1 TRINITY_DN101567_c0_g1~~TRINITY_DN101567_c0_g1_i1.p1  ORF type:complete len:534 (+),score=96.09 TRINITY_DN101567_c0_g1_i1:73-1674(+)